MSNSAEMANISHSDGAGMYLSIGDAKHSIREMDGIGSHMDTSTWLMDIPSIKMNTLRPDDEMESVRTPQKKAKLPDLPSQSTKWNLDKPNGCGNHLDTSNVHTDACSIGNNAGMAANNTENIRMHQINLKTQNSSNTPENGTCHDHAQPPPRPSHNSDPSPATPKLIAVPQLNPGHYVNLRPRTSSYRLLATCPV